MVEDGILYVVIGICLYPYIQSMGITAGVGAA